ncbi:unnamed protein product, partial [Nesidiocoris tenuis]
MSLFLNFCENFSILSQIKFFSFCTECSTRRRDERLRIPGRDGHQENGPAQDEDGVREKLERPQTRAERPGVHREDAGSSRTVADHRRSSTSAVGSPSPGCRRHRPCR